jgi:hypothetical protein
MERGSPEWILYHATQASKNSSDQLMVIAETATKRNKVDQIQLSQEDIMKVALTLSEIQHQSFMLGIQVGLETAKLMVTQDGETPPA